MVASENQEKEFVIPTRYKIKVSSRLFWPIGALELTQHLAGVPQIKELELSYAPSYGAPQPGKWPVVFPVVETRYTHPPSMSGHSDWEINVYLVPRNMRTQIREAFTSFGFKAVAKWFCKHARFSGRASNLRLRRQWHSGLDELNFNSHDNVVPGISITKQEE